MIALDVDGTLLRYDGWKGADHYGEPIRGMVEVVQEIKQRGTEFCYFTSRLDNLGGLEVWLDSHQFPEAQITNIKSTQIHVILDDRAIGFNPLMAREPMALADRLINFLPYWKIGR